MRTSIGQNGNPWLDGLLRRLAGCGLVIVGIALALAPRASGQTWIGAGAANNPTSGNWSTNGVWMGAGIVNGAVGSNTQLTFMSGTANYVSTNDIGIAAEVPFNLNSITFSTGKGVARITLADSTGKAGSALLFSPNPGPPVAPATISDNNTGTVTIQNVVQVATKQTLTLQSTNAASLCVFKGGIADGAGGTGGINMTSGNFTIDANSTYTGNTTVSGGKLAFGTVGDAAAITLGTNLAPTGNIVVSGGIFNIVTGGPSKFANAVWANTLTVNNGGTTILGATLALAGLGKYAGVLDTTAGAAAAPTVTVKKGGTLKGVGMVRTKAKAAIAGAGTVKGVKVNGKLAPGDGAGELDVSGGVEFGPDSTFAPVIDGTVPAMNDPEDDPSTEYSQLNVTDSGTQFDYDPSYAGDGFTTPGPILAPEIDYFPAIGDTLYLIDNNGMDGNAPDQFYNSADYLAGGFYDSDGNPLTQDSYVWLPLFDDPTDLYQFRVDYTANYSADSTSGGNDFALVAVPEPASVGLLAIGAMVMLKRRAR